MGGRGASAYNNVYGSFTKKQQFKIDYIKENAITKLFGERYKDNYEYKSFELSRGAGDKAYLHITIGRKGDEHTAGAIIGRDSAFFIVGKNGGLSHWGNGTHSKPTKTINQAFYDYTYGNKKK